MNDYSQKAIILKGKRIEWLLSQFKNDPVLSKSKICQTAIKQFGVTKPTAKNYSNIVYYSLIGMNMRLILDENLKKKREIEYQEALAEKAKLAQWSDVLRARDSLREQIKTLQSAVKYYTNGYQFMPLLQEKEQQLANIEDELSGYKK